MARLFTAASGGNINMCFNLKIKVMKKKCGKASNNGDYIFEGVMWYALIIAFSSLIVFAIYVIATNISACNTCNL